MTALICGSLAYDTIMVFPGRFREHILPDRIHMLNVSFLTPSMRVEFGGCAGNIAYNLKLIGGEGHPVGTVGDDFASYGAWMERHGVSQRYVTKVPGTLTAHGHVVTDLDDNQIWAFHPGAMNFSHTQAIEPAGVKLGLVSPDGRDGMLQHAQQFADAGVPFIFDPGQGLPMFNGAELKTFIDQATWLAVNDYESQVLSERTGLTHEQMAARVQALVVTRGAEGSQIYTAGKCLTIPAAPPRAVKDPTGCGDAYRAGLIYGLQRGLDWESTGRVASLLGALKIESHGPQNHGFSGAEFEERFRVAFGYRL